MSTSDEVTHPEKVRAFGVWVGYHRYFAHRSFETSRAFQFVLALAGTFSFQGVILWWAGSHRQHHRYTDDVRDPHSPRRGFWHAQLFWLLYEPRGKTATKEMRDFFRFPEICWLNRHTSLLTVYIVTSAAIIGAFGVSTFYFVQVVGAVSYIHIAGTVNSFAHRYGARRYDTRDDSRNQPLVALLTFGEGWHNNHHAFPTSARHGFRWWEIDISWYQIKLLELLRLVWDVKAPPARAKVERGSSRGGDQPQG